ncbi:hypothetical protein VK792_05735 [Mesobacterium sp. TK19101]|uniref:Uncharacterized protein n=1 Tax=Mesobacterium hydrothermale TaxID=3111907 RepID=A0ABU6HE85_9RHOB|nr:hypothetical protein [Mesobacterium sp. TK19101]MEC3860778.1 hypothetical protein [Mesobacterium sp. TK19101]
MSCKVAPVDLRGSLGLMRRRGIVHLMADLPAVEAQRGDLRFYLSEAQTQPNHFAGKPEPETLNRAIGRALAKLMSARGLTDLETAPRAALAELYVFCSVMRSTPGEAGRLSAAFVNPYQVLTIRDHLMTLHATRLRFERQRDTFEATRAIWLMRNGVKGLRLRDSLERMAMPDPDLWHHIVLEHDATCPGQREAALWCVQQSACDRATVAGFLVNTALNGSLKRAVRQGDAGFVRSVRRVIELWNAGWYCNHELALDPPDRVEQTRDTVLATLDKVACDLGGDPWPVPHGLFIRYEGRAVRRRDNWCLMTGTLLSPPKYEDYVDPIAA